MRATYHPDMEYRTVKFIKDATIEECSGVLVLTPSGWIVFWEGSVDKKPAYDPGDGREMFYPGWAEW